jgi:hypothetical protein
MLIKNIGKNKETKKNILKLILENITFTIKYKMIATTISIIAVE